MPVGFIRAIDVHLELTDGIEVQYRDAVRLEARRSGLGAGYGALDAPFDPGEGVNEVIDRRTGADTDHRTVGDIIEGGLARQFFHFIGIHVADSRIDWGP